MSEKKIEIFTVGCPVCDPVVQLVKDTVCDNCNITIHNVKDQSENKLCISIMEEYGIKRLPAIAVDGKLLGCCKNIEITKQDLLDAGLGIN